ncbi:hypothetical protein CLF_106316 [Clonorchis sinensis]|uniref:Uncharacterized protein n=1 Tax=Clonorchis sinensis TaxID=79923 RepID=G7YPW6_CLOSI|nr:hypothetical protein CLF_106316 [Clonorchis sinensis]
MHLNCSDYIVGSEKLLLLNQTKYNVFLLPSLFVFTAKIYWKFPGDKSLNICATVMDRYDLVPVMVLGFLNNTRTSDEQTFKFLWLLCLAASAGRDLRTIETPSCLALCGMSAKTMAVLRPISRKPSDQLKIQPRCQWQRKRTLTVINSRVPCGHPSPGCRYKFLKREHVYLFRHKISDESIVRWWSTGKTLAPHARGSNPDTAIGYALLTSSNKSET